MKKLLFLLALLPSLAHAETIEFYVVPSSWVSRAQAFVIANQGRVHKYQPILSSLVLTPINTNYYIISNPPAALDPYIAQGRAFLYQTYQFENGRMTLNIDNSAQFKLYRDWTLPDIN